MSIAKSLYFNTSVHQVFHGSGQGQAALLHVLKRLLELTQRLADSTSYFLLSLLVAGENFMDNEMGASFQMEWVGIVFLGDVL